MAEPEVTPRPRILVVDDEVYNRDLLVRTFARASEVVAVATAAEAVEVLERWPAEVLVTDFLLGPVHGVELARQVRARWPAVRIAVVTGFDLDPELARAQADGTLDDVISKPWAPAALRQRILQLVGR